MNFNSKDLFCNLLQYIADNTKTCHNSQQPTGGFAPGTGAPDGTDGPSPEQSLVALAVLKRQLKIQLDQTKNEETALKKELSKQTVKDAAALSERLDKALDELETVLEDVAKADLPAPEDKSAAKK